MERSKKISIIIFAITVVLIIISAIVLPDTVRILGSAVANSATYVPKLVGIIVAAIISIAGAVGILVSKKEDSEKYGILIISLIGMGLFVYMIVCNCFAM